MWREQTPLPGFWSSRECVIISLLGNYCVGHRLSLRALIKVQYVLKPLHHFYYEGCWHFVKTLFCNCWDGYALSVFELFMSIYELHILTYICWIMGWIQLDHKSDLYMILNSACKCFIEKFCFYVHQRD